MRKKLMIFAAVVMLILGVAYSTASRWLPGGDPVKMTIAQTVKVDPSDPKAIATVGKAQAFLGTLTPDQRKKAMFAFTDNAQRGHWTNFPDSVIFQRYGLPRSALNPAQIAALDGLLLEVLGENGWRNARMQMAADDVLAREQPPGDQAAFGSKYYYTAFLGEPRADAPWMLQFGGHHLAINVTFAGPKASFSPMLTGGQPLNIDFEGAKVMITREELEAAQSLFTSLDAGQKAKAVRSNTPIELVLGPGEYGTTIAREGLRGSELTDAQKQLLLALIRVRMKLLNARDSAAKMADVQADIDQTWFAWWGPDSPMGAAYFRVTGPAIVMEYSPQSLGGDATDHAHSMYRDPLNDYGAAWIAVKK